MGDLEPEAIARGVWRWALRTPTLPPATATNTLVVEGETACAVIEPGTPYDDQIALLEAQLDALRDRGKPLRYVVLTHHHHDHIGCAERLRQRYGAAIAAHFATDERVLFDVDRLVDEGDRLQLGGARIEFLFTPGHAPGHLVVRHVGTDSAVAHAGDLLAGEGTVIIDPEDGGDMNAYLRSLGRTEKRYAGPWRGEVLVPAHGPIFEEPAQACADLLAHRLDRERRVLSVFDRLGRDELDFETLLRHAYDDKDKSVFPLARRSLQAHIDKLVFDGRVRQRESVLARVRTGPIPRA